MSESEFEPFAGQPFDGVPAGAGTGGLPADEASGPLYEPTPRPEGAARFEYGKDGPMSVLVGVDGTETSINAFVYAAGVARRQSAALMVVYVWPYQGSGMDIAGYNATAMQEAAEQSLDEIRALATQARQELGISITIEIRHGDPSQQLLEAAKAARADQIVIGASAKMTHRFIGSVGVKMFRHGHTPITVVP